MDPQGATSTPTLQTVPCTLREFLLYFLRLGALGFGGPIALAGYMQRDLVEQRRWIIPAPYYRRWARVPQIKSFVDGVTAAATGAIAGATFVLGKRAIFDVPMVAIAAVAPLVLVKARKVPEPVLMLAAGAAGLILHGGSVR